MTAATTMTINQIQQQKQRNYQPRGISIHDNLNNWRCTKEGKVEDENNVLVSQP
jgi:hypothetical protein